MIGILPKLATVLSLAFATLLAWSVTESVVAAEQGTTTGVAAFHIVGEASEYPPDLVVFSATGDGSSYTDAGKGPLHFGVWHCTLEAILKGDAALSADGFCTVADPDGDKINLRWERTDNPGTGPIAKNQP